MAIPSSAVREVALSVPGGEVGAWVSGEGALPALVLHGGPGYGDYTTELAAELGGILTCTR